MQSLYGITERRAVVVGSGPGTFAAGPAGTLRIDEREDGRRQRPCPVDVWWGSFSYSKRLMLGVLLCG